MIYFDEAITPRSEVVKHYVVELDGSPIPVTFVITKGDEQYSMERKELAEFLGVSQQKVTACYRWDKSINGWSIN